MIQQPDREEATDYPHIRSLALRALKRWAWAASEDQDCLADILLDRDTPANRQILAKVFYNLGRPPTSDP